MTDQQNINASILMKSFEILLNWNPSGNREKMVLLLARNRVTNGDEAKLI